MTIVHFIGGPLKGKSLDVPRGRRTYQAQVDSIMRVDYEISNLVLCNREIIYVAHLSGEDPILELLKTYVEHHAQAPA